MHVAVWLAVCVWKRTPITADVTVTKIAGYVRVRILMHESMIFSYLWPSQFLRNGQFVRNGHFLHAGYTCMHLTPAALTRAEPCDWSAGITTMLGCHCGKSETQLKYC